MKKLVLGLLIISIMTINYGCNLKKQNNLTRVKLLLDWSPNTNHTGLFVAKNLGMYEAQGLSVEIIQGSEGGISQLIGAEKAQFGVSYQEEVTFARVEKIPVVAIAAINQHNTSGFASLREKNIVSPRDFENKKYGGWGSKIEEEILKGLMQNQGGDFKKLQIISIGSADFLTSIKQNIDFSWIFWGWDGINAELKGVPLNFIDLKEQDKMLDYYTPVLIASEKTIQVSPDLIKKFLLATRDGYIYAVNQPEKATQILKAENPELDLELVKRSQLYLSKQYLDGDKKWGQMDLKRWENYSSWLFDHGLMIEKIDNSKAFTNEFLPK